jgi:hypothetical protein
MSWREDEELARLLHEVECPVVVDGLFERLEQRLERRTTCGHREPGRTGRRRHFPRSGELLRAIIRPLGR